MCELEVFNSLKKDLGLDDVLPKLECADITITSEIVEDIPKDFIGTTCENGWYLSQSHFVFGKYQQQHKNLIEGEWHQNNTTTNIQLLNDKYRIVTISSKESRQNTYLKQTQKIISRDKAKLTYAIWWKSINGKYRPFLQQFIALSEKEEKS